MKRKKYRPEIIAKIPESDLPHTLCNINITMWYCQYEIDRNLDQKRGVFDGGE
jgi:hypothetical protein